MSLEKNSAPFQKGWIGSVTILALSFVVAVCFVACSEPPSSGGSGDGDSNGTSSNGTTPGSNGTSSGSNGTSASNGTVGGCSDNDGDGFGIGCEAGPDCNDFNAQINTCACDEGNFINCPCLTDGQTEPCFDGMDSQLDVGICKGGTRTCEGGSWGACVGQIPPVRESCDEIDNDCNGQIDDGLTVNACGTCNPLCDGEGVGQDEGVVWDLNDNNSDGLNENDEGGVELNSDSLDIDFLYVANSEEGTVSKIDTRTGREIARYASALKVDNNMPDSAATCPSGSNNPQGNCPSRTAVDLHGDVWVANRAFAGQGSVTKIANEDCIDRNGNGTIETSSDVNGNGVIDKNNSQEFLGEADECILFTVTIGGNRSIPRALAIDPFAPVRGVGSVWVGAWNENRYYQINGADGSLIRTVDVPHHPYGAVMDRFGVLWSNDLGAVNNNRQVGLVSIVSATGAIDGPFPIRSTNGCADGYGVSVGPDDKIWIGGWNCGAVFSFAPSTQSWSTFQLPSGSKYVRGVAADRDGWIYAGISHDSNDNSTGQIVRFKGSDGSGMQRWSMNPQGSRTIGVGLDYQNRVWGINQGSNNATRLDPNTGEWEVFPAGTGPYTYSDFTGYALRNFTAPQGTYTRIFSACPQKSHATWTKVQWDSFEPVGTGVQVRVKSVFTLDELVTAPQFGPFTTSAADLVSENVPDGKLLEVEITLWTDDPNISPILWNLKALWECPPIQ